MAAKQAVDEAAGEVSGPGQLGDGPVLFLIGPTRQTCGASLLGSLLRPPGRVPAQIRPKRAARMALAAIGSKWSGLKSSPSHSFRSA